MDNSIARGGDYLDRMRGIAVAALVAAAIAASVGSLLDWVQITRRPALVPGYDFGSEAVLAPQQTQPFTGIEAHDGWWVIGASLVILITAALLLVRKKSLYGWLSFLAAVVMGSIVFADYRGIGDLSSSISHRMDIVGEARPAIGLTMVAAAVLVAVIGSLVGVAASPRRDD
ncbi:MAG: hypothetical protein LC808_02855 [Actinobacteria bacterium]|nr:hypothetical protein [Actinomycetota bacterium]